MQVHRQRTQTQTRTQTLTHGTEREINGKTHIITPDGAVLASNFERSPGCRDYVTSFMQCYDEGDKPGMGMGMGLGIEFKDGLPAYYPAMQTDTGTDKGEEKDADADMAATKA